ncbi:para aminobenzoic acid synthetase [Paecilomyces variotii No. 5]|uniref:aminodeoxychorismate synthase n=1 Tax=Byssochlamys spectabilis (strain No. 5 / NBRC 109023) TaxID=1356009 RepID=V5FPJ6_BYSSN|nr:para aminobenzoic acid synthetase [Paecilomyces variotii No. 5]
MPSAVLEKPSSCQEGKHTSYSQNILYIDAYDSFSYNVVAMLEEALGAQVTVLTIDSEWPNGDMNGFLRQFDAVVLGPGPGHPATPGDVGIMKDLWTLSDDNMVPVLGICLGFQSLCFHHGIPIEQLPYPLHGQVRYITPVDGDVFRGLPDFEVTLYHSLYAVTDGSRDNLGRKERNGRSNGKAPSPDDLSFLAWLSLEEERCSTSSMQVAMAVRHREKPFWGFQFHPESCKSDRDVCTRLLKNWWSESLQFNKRARRVIFPGSLKQAMRSRGLSYSPPNIMSYMLQWSASTSEHAVSRFVPLGGHTTETICEALNEPGSPTVLFQSNGRYSIISVPSPGSWRLEFYVPIKRLFLQNLRHGNDSQTTESDGHHEKYDTDTVQASLGVSDFWNVLRYLMKTKKVSGGCDEIPFWGGLLGYFSYEMGIAGLAHSDSQFCQTLPEEQSIGDDLPDVSLLWVERSVVVDNETGRAYVQSTVRDDEDWIQPTLRKLEQLSCASQHDNSPELEELLNPLLENVEIILPDETSYKEQVQYCQVQLEAGESYELCLTCETPVILEGNKDKKDCNLRPWLLYRKLRKYNPAAFSAYARLGNVKIASSSPECFLNWDRKSMLEMKPMKGTVKKTPDVDLEKAKEILGSTKEMAENLMIADLIRHDLYGICGSSRVFVEKLLEVEDHGRVYQMITHVKGEVDHQSPGHGVKSISQLHEPDSNMSTYGITALQRCLPPGSMTGAPKERSCMHLSSIERRKRGIYSGVMGYLDLGGGGSFSVLIRTASSCSADDDDKQIWRVGAGGAVTTLSTAEGEWDEMITKLRTVLNVFTPSNKVRR